MFNSSSSANGSETASLPSSSARNKFADIASLGKSIASKGKTIAGKGLSASLNVFHSTAQSVGLKDKVPRKSRF